MRASRVPFVVAVVAAVALAAFLPMGTEAQQPVTVTIAAAQPKPGGQPTPTATPGGQPTPAPKPAAPAAQPSPVAKPAAQVPGALPRTGEADSTPLILLAAMAGLALIGAGAFAAQRRRSA